MDSVFTALHRDALLLDIVDEAWAADCLSDDDIDVPNLGGQQEDTDELNGKFPFLALAQKLPLISFTLQSKSKMIKNGTKWGYLNFNP
jgi:hypothetical protein